MRPFSGHRNKPENMSLILKALKKSEEDRDRAAQPEAEASLPPEPPVAEPTPPEPSTQRSLRPLIIGAGAVIVLSLAAWIVFRGPAPSPSPIKPAAEVGAKAKAATEAIARAEAEAKAKAAAEVRARAKAEAKAKAAAEVKARAEAEAKAKAAAEVKTRAEAEAKAKAAVEVKARAEAEAKAKAAAEAQSRAEAEAKAKAAAEAQSRAEAEAKAKANTAAKVKAKSTPRKRLEATNAMASFQRGQAFEQEGLYERAIEEYTQVILANPKYAPAYFGRGWSQASKGNHGAAIRNFTRALELDPRFTDAFFGRAWAYEQNENPGNAIDDYSRVIDLVPNHFDAYFSRGFLAFYQNRVDAAADDFATVYEGAKGNLRDFALIWRYLNEVRGGGDMVKSLAAFEGRDNIESWPGVLVSLFSGAVVADDVLAAARHGNPKKQRENECIAYFFIGQLYLIQGDTLGAREFFRKVVATGVTNLRQYAAAKVELKQLQR